MNYLQNLLELDGDQIAQTVQRTSIGELSAEPVSMVAPVVAEFEVSAETLELLNAVIENLCIPMLVTTSLLNQVVRSGDGNAVCAGLASYATLNADALSPVFRELVGDRRYLGVATLIGELQVRIGLARGMTLTFVEQTRIRGRTTANTTSAGIVGFEPLADAWCRACATGAEVIRMALHFSEVPDPQNHRMLKLMAWLLKAADGHSPCISDEGELSVPGWAERRSSPRIEVNKAIFVEIDRLDFACTLVDVSETGFKISDISGLTVGDELIVKLSRGNHCAAQVVWVQKDTAGLKSFDRLDPDDPIFETRD